MDLEPPGALCDEVEGSTEIGQNGVLAGPTEPQVPDLDPERLCATTDRGRRWHRRTDPKE